MVDFMAGSTGLEPATSGLTGGSDRRATVVIAVVTVPYGLSLLAGEVGFGTPTGTISALEVSRS